ncbi:MAG: NmrA family protein [Glaciihabitans sp.]|nr:NmrA family protein [Glaciihabitans sp.]
MIEPATYLVFGATGQTGRHFVARALAEGNRVRALVRDPGKLSISHPNLEVQQGAVPGFAGLDDLFDGVDFVVSMLGDAQAQKNDKVNTAFVGELVPAMRRQGVRRFLYQAGGLSTAPGRRQPLALRAIRTTLARDFNGQHEDNEAVMEYLSREANDIEWMVHRAGIGSDGPSKGVLGRSARKISIATFGDCADYNYRLLSDPSAVHTCDFSSYSAG